MHGLALLTGAERTDSMNTLRDNVEILRARLARRCATAAPGGFAGAIGSLAVRRGYWLWRRRRG